MLDPAETDAAEPEHCRDCIQPAIDHSMRLTMLLRDATTYAAQLRTRFLAERTHAPPSVTATTARSN